MLDRVYAHGCGDDLDDAALQSGVLIDEDTYFSAASDLDPSLASEDTTADVRRLSQSWSAGYGGSF